MFGKRNREIDWEKVWRRFKIGYAVAAIACLPVVIPQITEKRDDTWSDKAQSSPGIHYNTVNPLGPAEYLPPYNPNNVVPERPACKVPESAVSSPSRNIDYYNENFDDHFDDPEDIITYPDSVFDFLAD